MNLEDRSELICQAPGKANSRVGCNGKLQGPNCLMVVVTCHIARTAVLICSRPSSIMAYIIKALFEGCLRFRLVGHAVFGLGRRPLHLVAVRRLMDGSWTVKAAKVFARRSGSLS